jgi:SulP family sulfate permease
MPHRYLDATSGRLGLSTGLRESLREGYTGRDLRADVLAGIVVGIVALPLAMALAIASGVPPQYGLYTSIVAGALIPLLGGSRLNVSGPTAAFVVLLAPVSAAFGPGGLMLASMLAGVLLLGMGLMRMGRLIQFVPHPVTTGFTAGIGVVIGTLQLKDFLGLRPEAIGEHYHEKVVALWSAADSFRWQELSIGLFTLALLLLWPRLTKKIPSPLVAVTLAAVLARVLPHFVQGFEVATIGSRFSYLQDGGLLPGIPRALPHFDWPWNYPGPDGRPLGLSFHLLQELLQPAFAIAALGAIESLLCAVVADGMAGTRHKPDVELAAQGIGNIVAPFFGGIAATGAIARTATLIRAGGRSPIGSCVHALFVLLAVLLLAPLLGYLPMAALAALLLLVAWNMSDARHFMHTLRVAPRSDVLVLLTCFSLTVAFDMVIAVGVGIVLAALLFMKRMSEITGVSVAEVRHAHLKDPKLSGVVVYEIAGPLFFGAAEKAVSTLAPVAGTAQVVILQMDAVPVMDMTGLVALESAISKLQKKGTYVVLAGVQSQPREVLERAGMREEAGKLSICANDEEALVVARLYVGLADPSVAPAPAA